LIETLTFFLFISLSIDRRRPSQDYRKATAKGINNFSMKLDPTILRTMNRQDFRVLAAVETGMKSHELVPAPLVASIANLRHGGSAKILSTLLRDKLLSHDRSCGYDGYRLTTSGYDIMALENLKARGIVAALGDKIGTGKESDVYLAATADGKQIVLKFERLLQYQCCLQEQERRGNFSPTTKLMAVLESSFGLEGICLHEGFV
jgi:RIO-like serine/threonine protein kinase